MRGGAAPALHGASRLSGRAAPPQIPRFAFEKFPGAKPELTTQMKSVGEAMAFGRTFQESFQKARMRRGLALSRGAARSRTRHAASARDSALCLRLARAHLIAQCRNTLSQNSS